MKKTIFLLPKEIMPTTGGQQYDISLTKVVKNLNPNTVVITDEKLAWNSKVSVMYNYLYFLKIKSIVNSSIVITNSRLYPRLILFIFILKLINKNIRLICIHHHYNFLTKTGIRKGLNKYLEIGFLNMFHGIIIPSKYVKKLTEELLHKPKIHLLEIGFNKNATKPSQKQIRNKLLFVGTIEKRKGIHLLMEALGKISEEFELNIVGGYEVDGEYYVFLENLMEKYNLKGKVFFRGRVSSVQLENYYATSAVFVFPSLHEGYGMVIVEAMSYGLPVIAFNNSAVPYLVKNNYNGLLAENQNTSELQKCIVKLLNDVKEQNRLRENAFKSFHEIKSFEESKKEIEMFYKKILNEN